MPFKNDLIVSDGPETPGRWILFNDLEYVGETETWTVPAGYVTDFASVPRALIWLVRPYGAYTRAAVLHDYLITDEIPRRSITSRDVDGVFRRVMREAGVRPAVRWTMWAAVRAGALFSRERAFGRGFVKDAPAVLGIGVLALPVLLCALAPALCLAGLRVFGLAR